jgi:cytochrome P450/protein-S-isoprenylcysteine O-methyltransferase Ste14
MEFPQNAVIALGLVSLVFDLFRGKKLKGNTTQDEGTCMVLVASLSANMWLGCLFILVDFGQIEVHRVAWQGLGLGLAVAGLALRFGAMLQLGSSFTWELQRGEASALKTNGLFRWVRHPSYSGGLVAGTGLLLGLGNVIPVCLFLLTHSIAVARRIGVEERLLRRYHGDAFDAYAVRTGALTPFPALEEAIVSRLARFTHIAATAARINDALAAAAGLPPLPPGVPQLSALPLFGNMRERLANPIGLVTRARRELGDIGVFRAGPLPIVLLHAPRDVESFLQARTCDFTRGLGFEVLRPVLGDGLFTCPEDIWKPQRRLAQSSLQMKQVQASVPHWTSVAFNWTRRWTQNEGKARGAVVVDMKREASCLALEGYFRTQIGLHLPEEYESIAKATDILKSNAHKRLHAFFLRSEMWPTPSNLALRREKRYLNRLCETLLARAHEAPQGSFLAMHAAALAQGHEAVPHKRRFHEQLITFLITGHETVAATLAFGVQLLAFHPDAQARLHSECNASNVPELPTAADLSRLPFLSATVKEWLRLFPAAWLISKQATQDVSIGRFSFAKGTVFATVPFAVHRDDRFWSEPQRFKPERFLQGEPTERFAWFPFGAGPRACIGAAFATLELEVLLFHLVRAWSFAPVEPSPVPPEFSVTLKPLGSLPIRCERRSRDA